MRKATLSVLWLLLLGASTAAAQTDEDTVEAGAPPEATPTAPAEPAPAEPAPADDAAADDPAAQPADAQPADGQATDGQATTDAQPAEPTALDAPAPEPAPTTGPAPSDALSAPEPESVPDPPADEAAEAEPEPAAPPQLPWRNTFFSWSHQATFNSFYRGGTPTYNPYYSQSFSLSPRWYVGPMSYFLVSQSISVEITDADGAAHNREPLLSDTSIQFRQMIPWEGFMFMGRARVGLPASKVSQALQRYMQLGLGLTVVRPIPEIHLTVAGSIQYSTWLAGRNSAQIGTLQPSDCRARSTDGTIGPGQLGSDSLCDHLGGATGTRDSLSAGLTLIFNVDQLSIAAQYISIHNYGYALAPAYINVATSQDPIQIDDGSPSHWRNFNYVAVQVGYQFMPWLSVSLGIQNSVAAASVYNPDGSIRNPIITPDTSVYLSASVQLDTIYHELSGTADDGLTPEERQRRRQGLAAMPSSGGGVF